jgi:uncharacterized protein YegP (UPF0339 family)
MRKPKFEMLTGNDGKIYIHLKAATGEIVLTSRGFSNKVDAIQGIASVMRFGVNDSRFVRKETDNGRYLFQLVSPGGRVLGWSEMYPSKQSRDNGIVAVRRSVQFGKVLDLN